MRCERCPVSPIPFQLMPADGAGGGETLDVVDEGVREEDADTTRPALGKTARCSAIGETTAQPKVDDRSRVGRALLQWTHSIP